LKKNHLLLLVAALLIASWICASQKWFTVSMSPNQNEVVLRSFDGFTVSPSTSALLLVALAGISAALLSKGLARSIAFTVAAAAQFLSVAVGAALVLGEDLSAVANEIEAATGIAANHGLKNVAISTEPVAMASLFVFLVLAIALTGCAVISQKWTKSQSAPSKAKIQRLKDPISLWDQQR